MPNQVIAGAKNTLTSLLTSNSNKLAGRRILMTKAADGTTRVITGATNILPKGATPQSLIKVQPGQQIQIQGQGNHCNFEKYYTVAVNSICVSSNHHNTINTYHQ